MTLFYNYIRININELLVFDKDFTIGVFFSLIDLVGNLFVIFLTYSFVSDLNGWSENELLLFYAINSLGFSIWSGLFINTISLPFYIKDGTLDSFLTKPLSPIFQIMMDEIDEDFIIDFIVSALLLIIACIRLKVSVLRIATIPLIVVSSTLIYSGISILLSSICFFTSGDNLISNLTINLSRLAFYPRNIFGKLSRLFFTYFIPLMFISYFPGLFLMGKENFVSIIITFGVSIIWFFLSVKIWSVCLGRYESTGS